MDLNSILPLVYYGNTVEAWLYAVGVFLGIAIASKIFKSVIIRELHVLSKKTKNDLDDFFIQAIDAIRWPFFLILGLYFAIDWVVIEPLAVTVIDVVFIASAVYYGVRSVQRAIDYGTHKVAKRREVKDHVSDNAVVFFLGNLIKIFMWMFGLLAFLAFMGINITPMLAGLGIGGIAIGFALQGVLGDLFASFSIYFDKPFQKGDFIIIGDDMGTVEHIGVKSTRIRTLQGQELVVSNRELTETRINNYKKMEKRRTSFSFGVTYDTPTDKMKKIPGIVKAVIDKSKLAEFDRAHFKNFGDFSLNFEVVYYIDTGDYAKYMDIQQEINLGIKEHFEKEKIEMAFPTQTIHLNK